MSTENIDSLLAECKELKEKNNELLEYVYEYLKTMRRNIEIQLICKNILQEIAENDCDHPFPPIKTNDEYSTLAWHNMAIKWHDLALKIGVKLGKIQ